MWRSWASTATSNDEEVHSMISKAINFSGKGKNDPKKTKPPFRFIRKKVKPESCLVLNYQCWTSIRIHLVQTNPWEKTQTTTSSPSTIITNMLWHRQNCRFKQMGLNEHGQLNNIQPWCGWSHSFPAAIASNITQEVYCSGFREELMDPSSCCTLCWSPLRARRGLRFCAPYIWGDISTCCGPRLCNSWATFAQHDTD